MENKELFISVGLSSQKAEETCKNKTLSNNYAALLKEANTINPIDKSRAILLYSLASKLKPQIKHHCQFIVAYIADDRINKDSQVQAALDYFRANPLPEVNVPEFEKATGVGITLTPEDIERLVKQIVDKHKSELEKQRYSETRQTILKWADGSCVKNELDVQLFDLLGPKTATDSQRAPQKSGQSDTNKKKNDTTKASNRKLAASDNDKVTEATAATDVQDFITGDCGVGGITKQLTCDYMKFHRPGENFKTDGYVTTPHTMDALKAHLARTGGRVRTRFPPEPNGILHIGHAKAINFNFGYARANGGVCYLRYDDTNPEKEEQRFITSIRDMVEWLGYKPWKVTHASDHFEQLHAWAIELIRRDLAYVCHQRADELKGQNPPPSPWRSRPVEESLRLFEDMRRGKVCEGASTLRMKVVLGDGKTDPVAYRIKFASHPCTADRWCIYPTYDYTHCLCDSLEDITHSLCTKEFQARRPAYYWLCNALDQYCPVQWEYGRLNLNYTVVSKRKIGRLIEHGIVRDWDDPRLFTLTALRRRGAPPEAINMFCARVGVTMAQTVLDPTALDACIRDVLNVTAPRTMCVLEPLKVCLTCDAPLPTTATVPDFPASPDGGSHTVSLRDVVYIEAGDFRESSADDPQYKRLSTTQCVGLKHAGLVLSVTNVHRSADGASITHIDATARSAADGAPRPKAFIHWVADPLTCEVRLYDKLFTIKLPEEAPEGILSVVNPNSLTVHRSALIDRSLSSVRPMDRYQFERIGFFAVDADSTDDRLVFNRTVSLREDKEKS